MITASIYFMGWLFVLPRIKPGAPNKLDKYVPDKPPSNVIDSLQLFTLYKLLSCTLFHSMGECVHTTVGECGSPHLSGAETEPGTDKKTCIRLDISVVTLRREHRTVYKFRDDCILLPVSVGEGRHCGGFSSFTSMYFSHLLKVALFNL